MASDARHAVVFGASGLLGWAVLQQLLGGWPRAGAFARVTAVVRGPMAEADLGWPAPAPPRPALRLVAGVDLLRAGSGDALARLLRERVPGVDGVTDVFYFVFSARNENHVEECAVNCRMMQTVADAFNIVSPALTSFVYAGGTRGYGIYAPGGTWTAPLDESLADHLPADYAQTCAYPWFRQMLTKASHGRDWSWTEVCPDAVVGFSPHGSAFSLALHWAQYLSLYAFNHGIPPTGGRPAGETVRVAFPGCQAAWDSKFSPVSGPMLGRIAIHAALNPDACRAKVVNVADSERPTTLGELWPALAAWFGLVGTGPPAGKDGALKPGEYVARHRHVFEENGRWRARACGVGAGSAQLDRVGWWLTFDRHLSLERLRASGFTEQRDPIQGWLDAFEQFRAHGVIL